MVYAEITWIFVCAIVLSVAVGYGLGANDVSEAFGPAVGAKALTMKQALLVASVFEFAGAVLMGSGVTSTIRNGITNIKYFQDQPDVLAYGMLCAMLATALWMLISTYWELPTSSTQSIVSSIAGMAIVAEGWHAVMWSAEKSSFPYIKGMSAIILSWVLSPFLAAFAAVILFFFIRQLVLRSRHAYQRSLALLPLFTFITFFICTFFIIAKGGLQFGWQNTPNTKKAWISAVVAAGTCLISVVVGIPYLKMKVKRDLEEEEKAAGEGAAAAAEQGKSGKTESVGEEQSSSSSQLGQPQEKSDATPTKLQAFQQSRIWKVLTHAMNTDIHEVVETDSTVRAVHESVEVFDHKAETSFKHLQVFSACANAFAHGSNEVANAVGPLAAIYQIWRDTAISGTSKVPTWLLAVGGVSIVLGLATYGHKVMRAVGVRLTKLTNSRGFSVELATAAVVIVASRFDLPVSTTHASVGAIVGVGMLEGRRAVNWRLLPKFIAGWVATLVVTVAATMAFTAQGLYAPSKNASNQLVSVNNYLNVTANQIAALLNATGLALGNATMVEQAQSILALTATQTTPMISVYPQMDTQALAISYLANDTAYLASNRTY